MVLFSFTSNLQKSIYLITVIKLLKNLSVGNSMSVKYKYTEYNSTQKTRTWWIYFICDLFFNLLINNCLTRMPLWWQQHEFES